MSFSRVSLRPKAGPDAKVDDRITGEVTAAFRQQLLPLHIAQSVQRVWETSCATQMTWQRVFPKVDRRALEDQPRRVDDEADTAIAVKEGQPISALVDIGSPFAK